MYRILKSFFILQFLISNALWANFEFEFSNKSKVEIKTENAPEITSLYYAPKMRLFASASKNLLCVWDSTNFKRLLKIYDKNFGNIKSIIADDSFKHIYAASGKAGSYGEILKINLEDDKTFKLASASDEFLTVDISENDKLLAAGSADGKLIVISLEDGKFLLDDNFKDLKVVNVKFNKNSRTLAILLSNGQVFSRNIDDNFKTNSASFSSKSNAQSMIFLTQTAVALPADLTYESKFLYVERFLDRTLRSINIPIKNPTLIKFRYNTLHSIILANHQGDMIAMRFTLQNPDFIFFKKSPSQILDISAGELSNILASTVNGEIFMYSDKDKEIASGILICDEKCDNYAIFSNSGYVYSTNKNLVKVISPDKKDITDSSFSEEKTSNDILDLTKRISKKQAKILKPKGLKKNSK